MDKEILFKFIKGECTSEEKSEVIQLLEKDEVLRKEYADIKNIWALTKSHHEISEDEITEEFNRINRRITFLNISSYLKYAAILILTFCSGGVLFYLLYTPRLQSLNVAQQELKHQVIVPLGQTAEVIMPDSTRVTINSGSKLTYTTSPSSFNRKVELEGEAFFDVKKDPDHPFIVKTSLISIKVLGTVFNVEAYKNGLQQVKTTLIRGKVEIDDSMNNKLAYLEPGMMANYIKTKRSLTLTKVNIDLYTSWKDGLLTFRDIPLLEIAEKMERWYNVQIVFETPALKNLHYSGTILRGKPIDQILEVMKITANIHYKINYRSTEPSIIYLK